MANVRHLTPPKARLKQQSVSFSHFSSIQHINRGTYTSLYPRITSPTSHPLVPFAAAVTFVSAIFIFSEVAILLQRPEKIPWACWTCCIYDAKKIDQCVRKSQNKIGNQNKNCSSVQNKFVKLFFRSLRFYCNNRKIQTGQSARQKFSVVASTGKNLSV